MAAKACILKLIEITPHGMHKANLLDSLPNHLRDTSILDDLLTDLINDGSVLVNNSLVQRNYPSIIQFANQLTDERIRDVFLARLSGKTLQDMDI